MIIRKLFKAEMAHCVPGAYTHRCHYLHGHSYKFELFLKSSGSNTAMMVADFKEVKEIGINDFFDSFDHAVMMWEKDPLAKKIKTVNPERHIVVPFIPTAEMIAKSSFEVCQKIVEQASYKLKGSVVSVERVVVHETDTGSASYGASDVKDDQFPDIQFRRWIFSDGIKKDWKNKTWYKKIKIFAAS